MIPNPVRPTSHTYFSQRLKLHYLDWGNQSAEPVLLIHGSQDHCHNWDWTSEQLCQDYHVLVPDLRGHGDSAWTIGSSYNTLDYVYDIDQLVQQENLAPVNIIGHSLGGLIACLYAGIFPEKVKTLVSVEGVGAYWHKLRTSDPGTRIREWVDQSRLLAGRIPRRYEDLPAALHRMQESNPHLSEERAEHLTIHGSNRNEDGTYTWKFDNYTYAWDPASLSYEETTQLWEQINCPTLLLNATEGLEHRTGQDGSLACFKDATLIDFEDAGHWLHHDQFDIFLSHVQDFLRN